MLTFWGVFGCPPIGREPRVYVGACDDVLVSTTRVFLYVLTVCRNSRCMHHRGAYTQDSRDVEPHCCSGEHVSGTMISRSACLYLTAASQAILTSSRCRDRLLPQGSLKGSAAQGAFVLRSSHNEQRTPDSGMLGSFRTDTSLTT